MGGMETPRAEVTVRNSPLELELVPCAAWVEHPALDLSFFGFSGECSTFQRRLKSASVTAARLRFLGLGRDSRDIGFLDVCERLGVR